ncbi:MAG: alpha/beta fold hydrolase [Bacillota bacterium]|jgi:pimeloyl-ACP methyl ester carboxylesterase
MKPVKEGFVELDVPIYFRIYGEGKETVVFLHGNGENWQCFRKQIVPFVEAGYQVLLIDSRGHGHSGFNYRKKLTLELMADDVYRVLKFLNLSKVHLVGFSDGGNILLSMLQNHPECIKKAVLAGANFYPKGMKISYHFLTVMGWMIMWFMGIFVAGRRKNRQIMSLMVRQPKFKPSAFNNIDVPVLVMAGDEDMIKTRHTLLVKESFPNSQIAIIKDSDHFIFYRQPEVVNAEIIKFIQS